MNPDQTRAFLTTLEPDENHEFYWSGLHPSGKRIQAYGSLDEMLPRLQERNEEGFGIFIAVNAIKQSFDGGYPRRRNSDVERIRAFFADWDRPDAEPPELPLPPSLTVQTSPGKYHWYWCVDDCKLEEFSGAQKAIARKLGTDISIVDLSREMRVPGFEHTKDLAARREVVLLDANEARYTLAQVREHFPRPVPKFEEEWDGRMPPKAQVTAMIVASQCDERDDGGFNVPCPWQDQHTTKGNPSETVYYPPGPRNGGKGWFKCMHAHCQQRYAKDYDDYIDKVVREAARKMPKKTPGQRR